MKETAKKKLVDAWLGKADDSLQEAILLLAATHAQGAINRLYYACFQAVSALLVHDEVVAKSHKGLKAKFGELYVQTDRINLGHNTTLAKLFKLRLQADYAADADFDLEDAQTLLEPTKELLKAVKELISVV